MQIDSEVTDPNSNAACGSSIHSCCCAVMAGVAGAAEVEGEGTDAGAAMTVDPEVCAVMECCSGMLCQGRMRVDTEADGVTER